MIISGISATITDLRVALLPVSRFPRWCLEGAEVFAKKAKTLEDAYEGRDPSDIIYEHRAYVISSVTLSVNFAESFINNVFAEHRFLRDTPDTKAISETLQVHSQSRKFRYKSLHNKCNLALRVAQKPEMSIDCPPGKEMDLLIKLRNFLIHHKPTDLDIEAELRGHFTDCRLEEAIVSNLSHKLLGESCAAWAVKTTEEYVQEFCRRAGVMPVS